MLPVLGKLKSTHAEDIVIMIGSSWFMFWPHERGRQPAFVDLLPDLGLMPFDDLICLE